MKKYRLSIIIPIYNNGKYLRDRCINSLKKSSIFENMEILLIDDGSTDNETIKIVEKLGIEYENIKTYYFAKGGSGSPSRPRNKGIELSTCDYITYLDPDNEAINDGYYQLYKELKDNDFDIVLGNYEFIINNGRKISNYYNICKNNKFICNEIRDTKSLLLKSNFSVNSIQAIIIKKDLIIKNNVMMEGIGEDTVFFYEIMLLSKKIRVINEIIHLYYKNREDSLTNNIDNKYFDGHLLAQKRKKKIFGKFDILDLYLNSKQENHFKYYLYNKMFQAENISYAQKILFDIYDVYEGKWKVKDKDLKKFFQLKS